MLKLISQVTRLLTSALDGWIPGHSSPEADGLLAGRNFGKLLVRVGHDPTQA